MTRATAGAGCRRGSLVQPHATHLLERELTANALRDWCRFSGTGTSYIEPGSPWENPFVESFGSRLRDELLSVEQFDTLLEAQVLIGDWKHEYNTYRPHSSLGWRSPVAYATAWKAENQMDRLS